MKRTATYLIPASYDPEDLKEAISKGFQVKCLDRKNTTRIYFDTFDWLLYGAGLGLYLENNQYVLHLLDTGETVAACAWKGRTRPRFWWDFEDPGIRSDQKRYIDVRCLLPYVSARLKFRRLNLLNLDGKTVLRGTLEDLSVKQEHKFVTVTETFRIVPLRGYEGELTRLDDLLPGLQKIRHSQTTLGMALDATGIVPLDYSPKLEIKFPGGLPSRKATVAILRHLISVMRANEEGIKSDLDTEFLHDFRVSVRKVRSALAQIKGVFPPEFTAQFRTDMASIGRSTNRLKDLDVYLLNREEYVELVPEHLRPGVDTLFSHLTSARKREKGRVKRYLNSAAYRGTISHWEQIVEKTSHETYEDSIQAQTPVSTLARKYIRRQHRKILKFGQQFTASMPASDLHELRIMSKKLRYLLEFFATISPRNEMKQVVKQLKGLQDCLGKFNDLSVQKNQLGVYLEKMKENVSSEIGAFIGGLATALYSTQESCKADCLAAFDEFLNPSTKQCFKRLLRKTDLGNP